MMKSYSRNAPLSIAMHGKNPLSNNSFKLDTLKNHYGLLVNYKI